MSLGILVSRYGQERLLRWSESSVSASNCRFLATYSAYTVTCLLPRVEARSDRLSQEWELDYIALPEIPSSSLFISGFPLY